MSIKLPLEGVLVVALEQSGTGPLCSRNLADFGARVIKVERPGEGEAGRNFDKVLGSYSSADFWVNPSKESLSLDFKHPEAREIITRLVERADVVIENLRPGVAEEIGLHYETMRRQNPKVVFCQISAYGQDGPYAQKKAFDFLIQGEVGLIELTGTEDAPARVGAGIADSVTGLYATIAVMMALYEARQTGIGQHIDISMLDANAWLLANVPFRYWHAGDVPKRMGIRHAFFSPYGVYDCADGRINIAVLTRATWISFCKVIGRPDLIDDPRFASPDARGRNRKEIEAIVEPILRQRRSAEWEKEFDDSGVPCALVRGIVDVLQHPQFEHRGLISEFPSEYGPVKLFNFPAKFAGQYPPPRSMPPGVGEQTDGILSELGYSAAQVAALRETGAV